MKFGKGVCYIDNDPKNTFEAKKINHMKGGVLLCVERNPKMPLMKLRFFTWAMMMMVKMTFHSEPLKYSLAQFESIYCNKHLICCQTHLYHKIQIQMQIPNTNTNTMKCKYSLAQFESNYCNKCQI